MRFLKHGFNVIASLGLACLLLAARGSDAQESLPPLKDGKVPQNLDELWGGYDPSKEPLDTKIVREWKDDGATYRYVIFTIGTFKSKVARLAAFYAFPNGTPEKKEKLPAILDLHGGGQRANLTVVGYFARNGYAALSVNWGGNPMEGMKEGEPNTDWGALDATQKHNDHYGSMKPDDKTLDGVESPRNNNWFMLVLAARRGLTFLEQQPEVDPKRLGACGHSMGGKLTTDLAGIDMRVKVACASCGGSGSAPGKISGMPGSGMKNGESELNLRTIDDCAYIPRIQCPILYLSPTNDFAGPLDNMVENWKQIGSHEVLSAISPHFNHRHEPEFYVSQFLWLEQHLKGGEELPKTPVLEVKLDTPDGVPLAILKPDRPSEVVKVCIYYSIDPHVLTRFWRDGQAIASGNTWTAPCRVMSSRQPLYVIANVYYPLKHKFKPYQWIDSTRTKQFAISSTMIVLSPADLEKAAVRTSNATDTVIDDLFREWTDWYRLEWGNPGYWVASTRKIKDPKWRGPDGAKLAIDIKSASDNTLIIKVHQNDWGAYTEIPTGTYVASKTFKGSADWQTLTFDLHDFQPIKDGMASLLNWRFLTELELCSTSEINKNGAKISLGCTPWPEPRQFRNLRWIGGQKGIDSDASGGGGLSPQELESQIQKSIMESTDQEKRDRNGK